VQLDLYHAQIMDGDLTVSSASWARPSAMSRSPRCRTATSRTREIAYPHLFKALAQAGYHDWIGCEYNPRAGTREGLGWLTQQ
jgi:hydroxypyruvate isomerase